jgi:hypothetical protein
MQVCSPPHWWRLGRNEDSSTTLVTVYRVFMNLVSLEERKSKKRLEM